MTKALLMAGNFAGLVIVLAVNYLANALPFNGVTTGDISNRFDVLFKPAGYAFSIWGLIYLGLIVWMVYSVTHLRNGGEAVSRIGLWFVLSCLANAGWLYLWHHQRFASTVVVMLILLTSLIVIYLKLEIGSGETTFARRWLVQAPFSLYLGWISVATVANITIWLKSTGWGGFGLSEILWFGAVLMITVLLALIVALLRGDTVFSLVILWAVIAVAVNLRGTGLPSILAWGAALAVLLAVAFSLIKTVRITGAAGAA